MEYETADLKPWQSLLNRYTNWLPTYLLSGWKENHPDSDPIENAKTMQRIEKGRKFIAHLERGSNRFLLFLMLVAFLGIILFLNFPVFRQIFWIYVYGAAVSLLLLGHVGLWWWAVRYRKSLPTMPYPNGISDMDESLSLLLEMMGRSDIGFSGLFPEKNELGVLLHEKMVNAAVQVRLLQQIEKKDHSGHPSEDAYQASIDLEEIYGVAEAFGLLLNPREADIFHDYYVEADIMVAQP